jgi:hypothetical protein
MCVTTKAKVKGLFTGEPPSRGQKMQNLSKEIMNDSRPNFYGSFLFRHVPAHFYF